MFSLKLMSKGEKRCGLDATVGGLSRTMQSFRVAITAKGGYCWHVYKLSVLAINGKIRVCNDDKQESNNDSISNDETMRNCCLQDQEDDHREESWSFHIDRGYHEGIKEHAKDSLESMSL